MNKIIYLDAAATALKPPSVVDAEMDFLSHRYANAGRGVCARAAAADAMVAATRRAVADFIGGDPNQIAFVSGATDGLNRAIAMVNASFGGKKYRAAVSDLDHHSARMPVEHLGARGACDIVTIPLDAAYNIDVEKIPAADVMIVTAMSNVMGVPQDVAAVAAAARAKNPDVIIIVDAAQYAAHRRIEVGAWDADFVCWSGHKIGADTGVGVMYVRHPDRWMPDKFGGGMVNRIEPDGTWILNNGPHRFEAGTLPLTQIAGLAPAIDAWDASAGASVMRTIYDGLRQNPRVKLLTAADAATLTFTVDGMHVLDFGAFAGAHGVCLRVGNMCATWMMRALNIDGAARISAGAWNTTDDAHAAVDIINKIVK